MSAKWWYRAPVVTQARRAISSMPAPAKPWVAKSLRASRISSLGAVPQAARGNPAAFAPAYERSEERAEAIGVYLEPVLASPERIAHLERWSVRTS